MNLIRKINKKQKPPLRGSAGAVRSMREAQTPVYEVRVRKGISSSNTFPSRRPTQQDTNASASPNSFGQALSSVPVSSVSGFPSSVPKSPCEDSRGEPLRTVAIIAPARTCVKQKRRILKDRYGISVKRSSIFNAGSASDRSPHPFLRREWSRTGPRDPSSGHRAGRAQGKTGIANPLSHNQ